MSAPESLITSQNVALTNCDREQIQYAGAIQPHGLMLVCKEPELSILQASQNAAHLLGVATEQVAVGAPLSNFFSSERWNSIRERLQREKMEDAPVHLGREVFAGREFDLLAHRYDQVLIFELEARPDITQVPVSHLYSDLHGTITKLQATQGVQQFLDSAVEQVRAFTGFDRVMAYQFLQDGSGWVRSESLIDGQVPYLGLHYPPSDIPLPSRRLFSLTWLRHQPDIDYTPVPIVPENNPITGKPLDMSYAFLRSVSVMYSGYLKNMGTRSSMVMTLLKDGKLWGLIACHHHTGPKHVSYEVRVACEFLAHTVSLLIAAKEDLETYEYRTKLQAVQAKLLDSASRYDDFVSGLIRGSPNLLDFIKAQGVAVFVDGEIASLGITPGRTDIERIVRWLSTSMTDDVYVTDFLAGSVPAAAAFKDRCAGLLAMRLSKMKDDFFLWFRPEVLQTVNWAGDPRKPVDLSSDGQRLLPRTSFALWKETVQLKSVPWLELEVKATRELRTALLELVLRRAEEVGRLYADLERSHAELDSFAYIASHDLKEPLRGIHNYAEILRVDYSDRLDEEAKAKLATLSRLSQRMDQLLDSLLEYSRLGRVEFANAEVDLNRVVDEAAELLQARFQTTGTQLQRNGSLPTVKGDHIRLVEVFVNLISNAIKYNDKAEKLVEIGSESALNGEQTIYVRDNGIGIQRKHYEQIFQIFRRLHSRDGFGGGSGVGLTITRKIIERHNGRIWLESEPGRGTTFRFIINGSQMSGLEHEH